MNEQEPRLTQKTSASPQRTSQRTESFIPGCSGKVVAGVRQAQTDDRRDGARRSNHLF